MAWLENNNMFSMDRSYASGVVSVKGNQI